MKSIYSSITCLIFAMLSCGTDEVDPFVKLALNAIETDHSGTKEEIHVDSNCEWSVLGTPEWCLIETQSEESLLVVTVLPNYKYEDRDAVVSILGDGVSEKLTIRQMGITNSASLEWHTFPVNSFSDISDGDDGLIYRITGDKLFINSGIRDQIFVGHLVKSDLGDILHPNVNTSFAYNPITISSFAGGQVFVREQQIPSLENTTALAEEVIATVQTQNGQFLYRDTPVRYNSYRHLNLLGMGNLGLSLDELINGKSYNEVELADRTGLIYTYSQEVFGVAMDIPENLIQESLSDAEKEGLSYINHISYGRTALLIVETDYDYAVSAGAIKRYMGDETLTAEEENVLSSLKAWYISFDDKGIVHTETGDRYIIKEYIKNMGREVIIPLTFSTNNYSDNASGEYSFTFNLN